MGSCPGGAPHMGTYHAPRGSCARALSWEAGLHGSEAGPGLAATGGSLASRPGGPALSRAVAVAVRTVRAGEHASPEPAASLTPS